MEIDGVHNYAFVYFAPCFIEGFMIIKVQILPKINGSGNGKAEGSLLTAEWLISPYYPWPKMTYLGGFPGDSSVGKETSCNAGDLSLIPGSGRSTGEGIGYPLHYSWSSLVAQLVKNLPAVQETWVQSLGWEDPLGKGKGTHSSILAWRIPWTV